MNRVELLDLAIRTVTVDRQSQYGKPENTFANIAYLWNWYLSCVDISSKPLKDSDVAVMMVLLKLAREACGMHKSDNAVDIAGYAALYEEIMSKASDTTGDTVSTLTKESVCDTVQTTSQAKDYDTYEWVKEY